MPNRPPRYVLDAHAWIEYLRGSPPGLRVRNLINNGLVYTNALTLSEVVDHVASQGQDYALAARAVKTLSDIVEIDDELAVSAAKRHARMKRSVKKTTLGQAYLVETAKRFGAEIVTGDKSLISGRAILIK